MADSPTRRAGGAPAADRGTDERRRMRRALTAAGMGMWDLDLATGLLMLTGAQERAGGRATRVRHLREFMQSVHPEDRPVLEAKLEGAKSARGGLACEFRLLDGRGGVRWVAAEGRTVTGADGEPARLTGIGRDVTERRRAEAALRESEDRFRTMADSAPVMIWLADVEGRHTYVNAEWLAFTGRRPEEELGEGWLAGVHPHDREGLIALRAAAHARGDAYRTEFRLRRADGVYRWVLAHSVPRRLADGALEGHVGSCVDITERRAAEQRYRLLAEIGLTMDAGLSLDERLGDLARTLLPAVADMCTVDLVAQGGDGLRRVAAAHVDAGRTRTVGDLCPGGRPATLRVAAGGAPVLVEDAAPGDLARGAGDREAESALHALAIRSVAVVPLVARGRRIGVLSLATSRDYSDRTLRVDDLHLAELIAQRAALAIDNARLYEARAEIARTLQRALLPPRLPAVDGATLSAHYSPTGEGVELGGDFYDVFRAGDGAWILVAGDVCGKGPRAAALTALARYTLRAMARATSAPDVLLRDLNRAVVEQRAGSTRFVTLALARVVPDEGGLRVACSCAGHPPPLVQRADGTVESVPAAGPLVGVRHEIETPAAELRLRRGDRLVIYTDGLTEARVGADLLGEVGLSAVLSGLRAVPSDRLAGALTDTVSAAAGGVLRDDIAVLALGCDAGVR